VIIVNQTASVNPHAAPDPDRIARIHDATLARLIALRRAGDVPPSRLRLAGVPPLTVLEHERRRREHSRLEAAS
jgi:hypothetical protein